MIATQKNPLKKCPIEYKNLQYYLLLIVQTKPQVKDLLEKLNMLIKALLKRLFYFFSPSFYQDAPPFKNLYNEITNMIGYAKR